ncbi:MAG: hypothetical protein DRQ88_04090 [Epsilonproteobacteria bacterium]|nr:MAG: hypothetical protein DRQ89_00635 [Campylobacterota bacterium]RLA67082.1 MAG: hypothetical protein DRQ88_04090 [Campylobacterota bacterium]
MKTVLALCLILASFNSIAGDLKTEFNSSFARIKIEKEAVNYKGYKVIFLRGIFNNFFSNLARTLTDLGTPLPKGRFEPLVNDIKLLKSLGIDASLAPTITEEAPHKNGYILAQTIRESDKPVIIISHSKGGIDALYGLTYFSDIHDKVAGWINLQAPIHGTRLADYFQGNIALHSPLKYLLEDIMSGESKAFEDLTIRNMEAFHKLHKRKIAKIVKAFPVLSVGSRFDISPIGLDFFKPLSQRSAFEILNRAMIALGGGPNDGFTAITKTCLKGDYCLILDDIDHASLVVTLEPFHTFDLEKRSKIIFSLLKMLRQRM